MGKYWDKIKNILGTNLTKNLKKIIARIGKFLTITLAASLGLVFWLTGFISIEPIALFIRVVATGAVALGIGAIIDVFKNGNGNHTEEPQ